MDFSEAVNRVLSLDYLDSLQLGLSIRVLIDLFHPSKVAIQQVTDAIVRDNNSIVKDSDFYEGLNDVISPRFFLRSFRTNLLTFDDDPTSSSCPFCTLLPTIAPMLNLRKGNLHELRAHASSLHIKSIISLIADSTVEDVASLAQLLRKFFHPSESFEVADALLFCMRTDWFPDILPQDATKMRLDLNRYLVALFPSVGPAVANFLENVDSNLEEDEEDAGSLQDFIVDDDDEDDEYDSQDDGNESVTSRGS